MNRQTITSQPQNAEGRNRFSPTAGSVRLKLLGLLALSLDLAGCVSYPMLSEKERASVAIRDQAVVLLRIQCLIDNQSYEPFLWGETLVALGLASLDTMGELVPARHLFLSEESVHEGWTCFVLTPGVYYLAVLGPDSGATFKMESHSHNYLQDAPRWRIDIPDDSKLIYAGSIRLAGKAHRDLSRLGRKIIQPIEGNEGIVNDEHELAGRLLAEHFPESGGTKTILMQQWPRSDPIILRSPFPMPTE